MPARRNNLLHSDGGWMSDSLNFTAIEMLNKNTEAIIVGQKIIPSPLLLVTPMVQTDAMNSRMSHNQVLTRYLSTLSSDRNDDKRTIIKQEKNLEPINSDAVQTAKMVLKITMLRISARCLNSNISRELVEMYSFIAISKPQIAIIDTKANSSNLFEKIAPATPNPRENLTDSNSCSVVVSNENTYIKTTAIKAPSVLSFIRNIYSPDTKSRAIKTNPTAIAKGGYPTESNVIAIPQNGMLCDLPFAPQA
jgi:hypothetical protein